MEELIARRKQLKEDTARDWDVDTTTMYDEQIDALRREFDVLYDDILATCTTDEESNHQRQYDESADRCDEVKLALKRIFRGLLGVRQPVTNRIQPRDKNARNEVTLPPVRNVVTKRTLSSDSARTFDPLGILGPVTIISKLLLQSAWNLKLGWDEAVPITISQDRNQYRENLPFLESLKIDRCIKPFHQCTFELIGFSDASERAMGAVVYMRSKYENGD
ncbi:unnamed protein product [Allacma fusca]|uniref:Uncharacterized protein n=1 Tax=Allacma fusca TaxID=39272 RepID=A0A8J2LPB0_9HEXA|nr:unnamed protein product [Allacma fusca]